MIAIILVFVLYYATLGVLTSYLGMKILKRANMKSSFFVKFLYGLFWPVFIKHILPGIKDIICKDVAQESIKETAEYIDKIETARDKWYQQMLQQQNPGTLVGNSVTPENVEIPEDAIPIQEDELVGINKSLAKDGYKYVFNHCPYCLENTNPTKVHFAIDTTIPTDKSRKIISRNKIVCDVCRHQDFYAKISDLECSWLRPLEDEITNAREKVLEINCCPKCGNNDPNEFSISSNSFNTSEGLSNQDKIICNKCHDWAYIEDAKNSSWFK